MVSTNETFSSLDMLKSPPIVLGDDSHMVSKEFIFSPDDVEIIDISNGKVIAKGVVDHTSKVYKFSHFPPYSNPSALLIHTNEASKIWHEMFNHINYKYISYLSGKYMVIGLPKINFSKGLYQCCILGKHP